MKSIFALIITSLILVAITPPVLAQGNHPQNVDDMSKGAGANIAKFNFDSVDTFWSAAGCTIAICYDKNGEPLTQTSAITSTSSLIAGIIADPPVQTATYVADILQNSGFAPPAYAQGVGFAGLSPVLEVWKAFRNLAYFLFIIVFVVIGFMIMIRKKISSNAVLTIQEALPKIIVTLLLITFSYAIAGLLIDLMYLSIFAITGIFQEVGILNDAAAARNVLFGRNIISIGWDYFMGARDVGGYAAEAVGELVSQVAGGALGFIANGLAYLIIAVAILIALFRTLFQLIIAYVGIILSVVFAPLRLLLNAIPGSNTFGGWFKGLLANIAVFPAVAVMILLGIYLGGIGNPSDAADIGVNLSSSPAGFEHDGFLPPFIANRNAEAGSVGSIRAIIGLGIIMLLPEVVKMVKEALQVKESDLFGAAFKNTQAGYAYTAGIPIGIGKQVMGSAISQYGLAAGNAGWTKTKEWYQNRQIRKTNRDAEDYSDRIDSVTKTTLPTPGTSGKKPETKGNRIPTDED
jgi:hypothetical protein